MYRGCDLIGLPIVHTVTAPRLYVSGLHCKKIFRQLSGWCVDCLLSLAIKAARKATLAAKEAAAAKAIAQQEADSKPRSAAQPQSAGKSKKQSKKQSKKAPVRLLRYISWRLIFVGSHALTLLFVVQSGALGMGMGMGLGRHSRETRRN